MDEVKIGISSNLPKRLENLGAAHGVPLQVRVSFFGTVPMEETLHGYFGGERMLREVFRLSIRLEDWIARQNAYLNPPPKVEPPPAWLRRAVAASAGLVTPRRAS